MTIDPHSQSLNTAFNRARRAERDLSEMLGLAKGMLADGIVNEFEARLLHSWALDHPDALSQWPNSLIFSRLRQHFADGAIDDAERVELAALREALIGGAESILLGYGPATTLPLDDPPPLISWRDEVYVFTGRFAYGTRDDCAREVFERGGAVHDNVTAMTSFLVIGTFGSRDWKRSAYGRKIESAVKLRSNGSSIRIVGEDHWERAIAPLGV